MNVPFNRLIPDSNQLVRDVQINEARYLTQILPEIQESAFLSPQAMSIRNELGFAWRHLVKSYPLAENVRNFSITQRTAQLQAQSESNINRLEGAIRTTRPFSFILAEQTNVQSQLDNIRIYGPIVAKLYTDLVRVLDSTTDQMEAIFGVAITPPDTSR